MLKKILVIVLFSISPHLFAETCPTIAYIKTHAFSDWKIFDSDDGKALSEQRATRFKHEIEEFALAESVIDEHKKSVMHCYYRDKNGSNLEAYLAKENLISSNNKKYWYEVSGAMHCAADVHMCEFQQIKHLAQK
jgi:hypothetical protein